LPVWKRSSIATSFAGSIDCPVAVAVRGNPKTWLGADPGTTVGWLDVGAGLEVGIEKTGEGVPDPAPGVVPPVDGKTLSSNTSRIGSNSGFMTDLLNLDWLRIAVNL
jgi:hypothetical protein